MGVESSTEALRRMLDERGVEWRDSSDENVLHTTWNGMSCWFDEFPDGWTAWGMAMRGTPEQAIAATLGRWECRNASKVMDEHGQARFACSECHAWIDSRLLWNPEYRNGESPWVSDCKLNFCPNCGRRIVGPTTNDADAEVDA